MPKFYFSNHEIPIPCVWGGGVVYYMTTNYNYFNLLKIILRTISFDARESVCTCMSNVLQYYIS